MPQERNRGYALLLVLVTLTICGVLLMELASRSVRLHTASLEQLQALQTRWGRLSCNRVLLRESAAIFDAVERQLSVTRDKAKQEFPITLRESIVLGNQLFTAVVTDESAKLNINTLRVRGRPGTLTKALQQVLGTNAFRALRDLDRNPRQAALTSWGEVFDLGQIQALGGTERDLVEITRGVTLWGSGELNIRRASDRSLELACKSIVTDGLARRIVQHRDEAPTLDTESLLRQTVLNDTDRAQLEWILGDGSNAYSVWIECAAGDQRSLHFSVLMSDEDGRRVTEAFSLE